MDIKILLLVLAIPFSVAFADSANSMTIQGVIMEQINSLLHQKMNLPLELGKKQITEYSLVGAIALVVVISIAASARPKTKKPKSKLG